MLTLKLAETKEERAWVTQICLERHYLRKKIHPLARPLAYIVQLGSLNVGCIVFARPQATRTEGWWGSESETNAGKCRLSYWEILCLSRVWLDPCIQRGGEYFHNQQYPGPSVLPGYYDRKGKWQSTAASYVVNLALERIGYDYLIKYPPIDMTQRWQIREIISYCYTVLFTCTLYLATSFKLARRNKKQLETYVHCVRQLTEIEQKEIGERSKSDTRARKHRSDRSITQLHLPLPTL